MQRKTFGDTHPLVAMTLNSLSRVLLAIGQPDEAASSLQLALDIARPRLGSDHQLVAIYTINLASVQMARRQPRAAEALLREGLRIRARAPNVVPSRRRTFLEHDWSIGATKSLLGASLAALGRYGEAETVLLEARRDLEASPARQGRELQATITRLVDLYAAWGRHDAAASYRAP